MKSRRVVLLDDAVGDLDAAVSFYESMECGLGDYCFDSLISDIEGLTFFAGIHPVHFGAHCLRAKRFPFNIYYEWDDEKVVVLGVLDMRQQPEKSLQRLRSRE
ncbi:hypothetical protein C8D92_107222 [Tamilnaduibacter salinus]|uniref:Type II toxin-antitoxin system RelE/ParE family toxin n=1 Tax=Tamilnaduibacter salinus TaxID=1484056 RepID=A0A2U1CVI9_9GAMM|nr:hypothetical protein [Tamilnaduibacter salinus]PVY75499.1 hypothetical protein C8D92_107222 [Tamilnaduibacter salinus]